MSFTNIKIHGHASDSQIAEFIHTKLRVALTGTQGSIAVAFPGGSTPAPIMAELVEKPLEWNRVQIFPTDDRMVEEDDPASNTGKLRALFEPRGALITELVAGFDTPHFTMVWLGMGTDGHIASLFPSSDPDPLDKQAIRELTPDPLPPEAPYPRVTLTIPALIDCDDLVFVIRGAQKRRLFEGAIWSEHDLPVRRVLMARQLTTSGPVTCFT
jgi:6-phosphogluconolactonase